MKQLLLLNTLLALSIICRSQNENGNTNKEFSLVGQLEDITDKTPIASATVSLIRVFDSSLVAFIRTDSLGKFSNGDTLEFNSESFNETNAVVEEMLKKMPGVEVDRDGTFKVNGKKINRVLVNGKDFFNGDPKLATRNLAADAVDKVQVFDKQSDLSAFTGIDDGNAEKTINLKLKKDKKYAAFGKLSAAAGTNSRYDNQFNVNKFKADQQFSAIGMANNTNRGIFADGYAQLYRTGETYDGRWWRNSD